MAILSASEIHDGRSGSDDKSDVKRVKVWRVITDDAACDADDVLNDLIDPFAQVGAIHPLDPELAIVRRTATNETFSKTVWIVRLEYKSRTQLGVSTEDPLDEPAKISWSTTTNTEPVFFDKDGDALLNSAGDYYVEGIQAEVSRWEVKVKKNVNVVPTWYGTYRNAINSSVFTIDGVSIAARSAKINNFSLGEWKYYNKVWYRELDFSIKIYDTWIQYAIDQGLRRLVDDPDNAGGSLLVPCLQEGGKLDATSPCFLDGSGGQLAQPVAADAVIFNAYYIYPEKDFNALPLL